MTLTIEANIPLPESGSNFRNKGWAGTLRKLQVGESVLLPTNYSCAYAALKWAEHKDFRSGALVMQKDGAGYRVWRKA